VAAGLVIRSRELGHDSNRICVTAKSQRRQRELNMGFPHLLREIAGKRPRECYVTAAGRNSLAKEARHEETKDAFVRDGSGRCRGAD
jgi:hypothetical protein